MADAVHYLTRMDPAMPPTTESGCNGFPFLWKWGNPSIDPNPKFYPISMPLEERTNTSASIARLHKRVRKWKLITDALGTDGSGNTYSLDTTPMVPGTFNPTRELNNIQPPFGANGDRLYRANLLMNGGSAGVGGQIVIIGTGSFYKDGVNCYPNLQMTIPLFPITNLHFSDTTGSDPHITGTLDGVDIEVYYDAPAGPNTFTMTQFDLIPAEFWPYAAADGSPIYDTTTGAVLQDPRS